MICPNSRPTIRHHLLNLRHIICRFYNVTLNIGQPSKPYFLDPDTGSDLTWLQCDVPGSKCTEVNYIYHCLLYFYIYRENDLSLLCCYWLQAPHPLYRPHNNLVVCRDPLCKALNPSGEHKCESAPEQCDYEVQYADGGSSIGVLVQDVFSINLTNGMQFKPRLPLGFVTSFHDHHLTYFH
jgi:hypothetical protein